MKNALLTLFEDSHLYGEIASSQHASENIVLIFTFFMKFDIGFASEALTLSTHWTMHTTPTTAFGTEGKAGTTTTPRLLITQTHIDDSFSWPSRRTQDVLFTSSSSRRRRASRGRSIAAPLSYLTVLPTLGTPTAFWHLEGRQALPPGTPSDRCQFHTKELLGGGAPTGSKEAMSSTN